jgi:tetratricopeptide (TPR) repeat protein
MHAWTYLQRLAALHQLGRYREELRLARELARRYPAWAPFGRRDARAPFHANELMALAGLGWSDSLRAVLAGWEAAPEQHWRFGVGSRAWVAGLELMAHGHEAEGREVLETALAEYRSQREGDRTRIEAAWIASWLGRLAEARGLAAAGLPKARTAEDSLAWLGVLGSIAALERKRAEATSYDSMLALAASRAFVAGAAAFRRAEIASSLGDRAGAVRLLEAARANTRGDAAYVNVHRWPYFATLRGDPAFEQFLRPRD